MPQHLESFIRRMAASRVALPEELRGCSSQEIAALEQAYSLNLPGVYREYLTRMGHCSARLFTHDHMAVTYPHVRAMTGKLRARLQDDASRILPSGTLIIAGRLGEDFEFIACAGSIDTPVQ